MSVSWIHHLGYFGIPHSVPQLGSRQRCRALRLMSGSRRYSLSTDWIDQALPQHFFFLLKLCSNKIFYILENDTRGLLDIASSKGNLLLQISHSEMKFHFMVSC